jgi:hypothetical protein
LDAVDGASLPSELARVVSSWDRLPAAIKAGILRLSKPPSLSATGK